MKKATIENLSKKGWKVSSVQDFLQLSEEEMMIIEYKIALGKLLKAQRKKNGFTQNELAKMIKSDQARIAKMENGNNGISLESIFKSLFVLKTPNSKITKVLAQV